MGLFDEDKKVSIPREWEDHEKEYEKPKSENWLIVIGSLIFSFIIGFAIAKTEHGIFNPFS